MTYDYNRTSKTKMSITLENGVKVEGEFLELRISVDTIPDNKEWYQIRHSDEDWIEPVSLKRGGIMVYSTCTINRKENENVVKRFIHENSGYSLMDFSFKDTQGPDLLNSSEGMLTLLPENGTDGFFIARIVKN